MGQDKGDNLFSSASLHYLTCSVMIVSERTLSVGYSINSSAFDEGSYITYKQKGQPVLHIYNRLINPQSTLMSTVNFNISKTAIRLGLGFRTK